MLSVVMLNVVMLSVVAPVLNINQSYLFFLFLQLSCVHVCFSKLVLFGSCWILHYDALFKTLHFLTNGPNRLDHKI
jgi:hypothetical protein